jgi:GntR family transcriptional regulator
MQAARRYHHWPSHLAALPMPRAAQPQWIDDIPIYRQLMDLFIGRILDQTYAEGEMLPSVRQLASDYEINPLTVAKAYKELSREGLTDRLRGEGLLVRKGVREALLKRERHKFLKEEWPALRAKLKRLDISLETLTDSSGEK